MKARRFVDIDLHQMPPAQTAAKTHKAVIGLIFAKPMA